MVLTGIDRIEAEPGLLGGLRLGLVTNPTGLDRGFRRTVDILRAKAELAVLFGPEHGVYGEAQAAESVPDGWDARTGLPVRSLFGARRKPSPESLSGLDALVFDVQDVGLRWYTYLSTLAYAMEACAESGKTLVLLDRPNPLGGLLVEGPLLERSRASFIGRFPLPARYALTIGEFARWANEKEGIGCELDVVELDGWSRDALWPDTGLAWVPPSPNLPTFDSVLAYAGTCLLEGSNVSEGRGTTKPFETVGAPWIDGDRLAELMNGLGLPGLRWRPLFFKPSFSKHAGSVCGGVQLHVEDPRLARPFEAGLRLLYAIRDTWPGDFALLPPWTAGGEPPIDHLTGDGRVSAGAPVAEILAAAEADRGAFAREVEPFLLYGRGPAPVASEG